MQARMEHSSKHNFANFALIQQNQLPGVVLGWTQPSPNPPSEASAAPSQSASSVLISPGDGGGSPSESSGQSCFSLKEHDYIGLAEVSSASSMSDVERKAHAHQLDLNLEETDLRLGLGPAKEAPKMGVDSMHEALELKKNDALDVKGPPCPCRTPSLMSSHGQEAAQCVRDDVHMHTPMSNTWQCSSLQSLDGMPIAPISVFASSAIVAPSKIGVKRVYSETMAESSRDVRAGVNLNSGASLMINTGDARPGVSSTSGAAMMIKQLQDSEVKSFTNHQQNAYWSGLQVPSWQSGQEHSTSSYCPSASRKSVVFASVRAEKDGDTSMVSRNAQLDLTIPSDSCRNLIMTNQESASDEASPAKGQVVGWPPVRSYRRSTLASCPRPAGDDGDGQLAIYVKVNMDGIPIGRKISLNAYSSYEGLLSALEEMFQSPNSGQGMRFLNGSEFVLTYEDKEGDWMLVGDVPWGMFVNTVRRLRIMHGSDTTGLGSRTSNCRS